MARTITFSRTGEYTGLSERAFMFVLGLLVTGGVCLTAFTSALSWGQSFNGWVQLGMILVIFASCFGAASARTAFGAISGYTILSGMFGLLLGPSLARIPAICIAQCLTVSAGVVAGMWVIGTAIPAITKNFSSYIIGAILFLICGDLVFMFMPAAQGHTLWSAWNIGIAFVFSMILIYDVNKAMQIRDRCLLTATQGAVGIYLDILNIVLAILNSQE